VPRLGNKTLDPEARGGGRTFTPRMLRRMVYECLGMGVPHIGPITWDVSLGDGEWFIKDTPAEAACREVFAEIREAAPFLEGMARVQPRLGLYISDATWRDRWNPRWTAFFQDALRRHDHLSLVGDAMIGSDLASRVPALVCVDNTMIARAALDGLANYLDAGGRLVVWGAFAACDEWGEEHAPDAVRGVTEHAGCTVFDLPPGENERVLVNRFQTGDGAWAREHRFHAAPYAQLIEVIRGDEPLHPVRIETRAEGDALTVLPLTDGVSLMVVLVNNGTGVVRAALRPSSGEEWSAFDALSRSPIPPGEEGLADIELGGHATRLVWFAPKANEEVVAENIADALASLERWDAAGADTGFLAAHRAFLSTAPTEGALGLKAHALSLRVLGALCGVIGHETDPSGLMSVTIRLTDSTGTPAEGCAVEIRAVPGGHRWVRAEEPEPGLYRAICSPGEGDMYYDVLRGAYRPFTEVRRVTARMRDAGRSGGADIMVRTTPDPELVKAIGLGASGDTH
jgi:hypothetical protein